MPLNEFAMKYLYENQENTVLNPNLHELPRQAFELDSPCRKILDNISEGVFIVNCQDRRITYLNQAAQTITGFSFEQAFGRRCFDLFETNRCRIDCPMNRTLQTGEPVYDFQTRIINKSGTKVPVSISTSAIRDEHGNITSIVEIFRDLTELETLRRIFSKKYCRYDIVSKSPIMQHLFDILPKVAHSEATILLEGASGTGKGLVAKAIHNLSPQKDKKLIKINCGAIPETLLESELFGYAKGAFTDAKSDKPGLFSIANDGTLFLDEVGDMSHAFQVKLLKVLEEKEFYPVGATRPSHTNARIITASNKNIESLVMEGKFRKDLYYRLNIIKLVLPDLKDRKEDIPLLVETFIRKITSKKNKPAKRVSSAVMMHLLNYDYPGNIRELENILEHACVLCTEDEIQADHLPMDFIERSRLPGDFSPNKGVLHHSEARLIRETMHKHKGNRSRSAKELGISRSTLWRKLKQFNLD